MTDKTDTEMTISKSYSRQAVNRLCETMTTPVSKSEPYIGRILKSPRGIIAATFFSITAKIDRFSLITANLHNLSIEDTFSPKNDRNQDVYADLVVSFITF